MMHDLQDLQATFALLCPSQKSDNWEEQDERQEARICSVSSGSACDWSSSNTRDKGQTTADTLFPLSNTASKVLIADIPDSESISSHTGGDCSQTATLPTTYHVWYEFHKLRYTIRIHRSCPLPSSLPSSSSSLLLVSPQPPITDKRQIVVDMLQGPAGLKDFDTIHEKLIADSNSIATASTTATNTNHSTLIFEPALLNMRRSLRGGWHIRITSAGGKDTCFRACRDLTSLRAWKDHVYKWSEAATGRIIARSGQFSSSSFRLGKGKPFMQFTCGKDLEKEKECVLQQTRDDLVACWTAWFWAEQVLPSVNARCSIKSSKLVVFFTPTGSAMDTLMNVLTETCSN